MANNFDSNFTRKLAEGFLPEFDSSRVLSKEVNTQLLAGKFGPNSGENVDFKRPTDYVTVETADGDLTSETASPIVTGKATGTVQNYLTSFVEYDEADEAIKMGTVSELLAPMATRMKTSLEIKFASFMLVNTGQMSGTYGTAVSTWDHVARMGALMEASGIPMDGGYRCSVNPFTQQALASNQRSLGAGGSAGKLISDAQRSATIAENFAGMKVMTAVTLPTVTSAAGADRVGALASTPTATYVSVKDSMKQSLAVSGFQANLVIKAGQVLQVAGRNRLNLSTRQPIIDHTGAQIVFTGTVTTDVTLDGSGTGTVEVTGPGVFEPGGAFNTVDSALTSGDVVTLLGAASTLYQPNLFWHKDAFSIGSVPIKKLHSTDTLATTKDGLQFRVSRGSDFTKNQNKVRIDFRPAFACLNPFFAGQGWGYA